MSVHVITASAGSGKTYRLTEVLSQRLSQPAKPGEPSLRASEVIATTFTVRAAADLVEKTQKRLLDDGNIAAAEEISTALIGTINSMSGRLVTDYAIDAGFSPELRVLDETEQEVVFAAAVDEVVAEAEATHRDLLLRTGHNGGPDDQGSWGHGPIVWSRLVKSVAEAARANHLGEEELRSSARASAELYLSALPEKRSDERQTWRDCLASDIEELRTALNSALDDAPPSVESRVTVKKGSIPNVEDSLAGLEKFLRNLDVHAEEAKPFAHVPWSTWAKGLTSYFMLKQGRFVSTDSALDPNFTGGGADSFDDEGNALGGDPAGLWPIIQRSVEEALTKIATGRFDSPGSDIYAELQTAPGVRNTEVTKALKALKEEALAEQRLFVIKPQTYSDFNLIYGIAGDHS